jgi:hypothetical protein
MAGKKRIKRVVERRFRDDPIAAHRNHALQPREIGAGGLEVQRDDIEERFFDWRDDQLSADDARTLLVP